jgi:squalene synthase HpnC
MSPQLQDLAKIHYENFPVGSFLIPRDLRKPVHLVYAFARTADDFADEGTQSEKDRLKSLDKWEQDLINAIEGKGRDRFFDELAETIHCFSIPIVLFQDLITAFRMDARSTAYKTFNDLLGYCKCSANPIGRILLHIFKSAGEENFRLSDEICTALQLTNFWQDISIDTQRNRFYIPEEDFAAFGCNKDDNRSNTFSKEFASLMAFEVNRTRGKFRAGKPLIKNVDGKLKFELQLTWNGGMRILEKIEGLGYDTVRHRPALSWWDWITVFKRSVITT